jgi:hypothetical protein
VPPTVTVNAGETAARFKIDSRKIGAQAIIRIYGSVEGQGLRTAVVVNP